MRYFPALLTIALCLTACSGEEKGKERPAALVAAAPVTRATFADRVEAVGTALADEQVVLSAPVTDRLVAINFKDGGYVARGQVIARLSQGQETAELAAAQAQARAAGQQLERIEALRERGFATSASLDAQLAITNAARANAQLARASIGDRIVRAPFAGYASLRTVSAGTVVTAGTPIATISAIDRIKLDFTVPETQLPLLRVGGVIRAVAAAWPDRPFEGKVATIDPVIDPETRAARVRAILPNPDRTLKPGMLLTVTLLSRQREALAVPELAVVGEGDNRYVFLVADGKAKRVAVETGARQNGLVEITGGLKSGQRIVTEGVVKLSDGMAVRVAGTKAPAPDQQKTG